MIQEVTDRIKIIRAWGRAAYPYCHCLYVDSDIKAVIDTGAGSQSFAEIDVAGVDLVLYTHFHTDHTHGHELFDHSTRAIHPLDYPPLSSREDYIYFQGRQLWEKLVGGSKLSSVRTKQKRPDADLPNLSHRVKSIERFLQDEEVIDLGRTRATVVHTPGHTPGHCSFFFEKEGVLFTGDIDMTEFGPWYGEYLSNVDDFISSIEKIKALKPGVLISPHRRLITENIVGELDKYLEKLLIRERRILDILREPTTLSKLADCNIIYPRHENVFSLFWEKMMLLKHLERLEQLGLVVQDGGLWRRVNS